MIFKKTRMIFNICLFCVEMRWLGFYYSMRICTYWNQKWEGFLKLDRSGENPVGKFYNFAFLRLKNLFFRYFLSYPVRYQTAALLLIFGIKLSLSGISFFICSFFQDAQAIFSEIFKILRFIFLENPFICYIVLYTIRIAVFPAFLHFLFRFHSIKT